MSCVKAWEAAKEAARAIPLCAGRDKRAAISDLLAMLLGLLRGVRRWK
jgi:hypothetical protein